MIFLVKKQFGFILNQIHLDALSKVNNLGMSLIILKMQYSNLSISADTVKSQKNFCDKQNFFLLSDPDKDTINSFKAIGIKKMYGKEYEGILRVSYLIDEKGIIEKVYDKVQPKDHAKEVLNYIKG